MRFLTLLLLVSFFSAVAVAGYIEVAIPHPTVGECAGCWVEHGFGTAQNLDDYRLILVPVIWSFVSLGFLLYFFIHNKRPCMEVLA